MIRSIIGISPIVINTRAPISNPGSLKYSEKVKKIPKGRANE